MTVGASRALALAIFSFATAAHGQVLLRSEGGEATGTALDPAGEPSRVIDLRGLSVRRPRPRRTPSGFVNPEPFAPVVGREVAPGWWLHGSLELGYLGSAGDTEEARYERYADWSPGLLARDLVFGLRSSERDVSADLRALDLGRDDALYVARIGLDRWLRVAGFYSELPHPRMNDARSLYEGRGSEALRLPAGLVPGASAPAQIDAALAATPDSSLRVQRARSGVDLELFPHPGWELSAAYRFERKEGELASGGSMFFGFVNPNLGSVIELPAPVDQHTHDLSVRVAYADPRLSASLGYDFSLFDNAREQLTWENPFGGVQPIGEGRLALAPDNHAQGVGADLAVVLPFSGRFTSRVAWRRAQQDASLLPPTVNPALPDWNTTAALEQATAGVRVDTLVAQGDLLLQPWRPLRVRLHLRYDERDRHTTFESMNPLLPGVYGYIGEDGGAGTAPLLRRGPVAFDRERLRGGVELRLRAVAKTALTLAYQREGARLTGRERNRVADDEVRFELTSRSVSWLTARASYSFTHRSGSPYEPDPNAQSFLSVGGTPPLSAPELRKRDLASRDRHLAQLRLAFLVGDAADLSLTGRYRCDDYDAGLGLQWDRGGDVTVELATVLSPRLQLSGHATYERRTRSLAGRNLSAVPPAAGQWALDADASTVAIGTLLEAVLHPQLRLSFAYDWLHSVEEQPYRFASTAALSPFGGASAAAAGSAFSDLEGSDHLLETSLRLGLADPWSLRVFYRYLASDIADFHQTGLPTRSDQRLFLGHEDRDFAAHAIGATVELRY